MLATELSENLTAGALIVFALTGLVVLVLAVSKGRSFVAQYKDFKLSMDPQSIREVSSKLDKVITQVNKPNQSLTLMQRLNKVEADVVYVREKVDEFDGKFAEFGQELANHTISTKQWQEALVGKLGIEIRSAQNEHEGR